MSNCEHNFQFQGVVYTNAERPLPGSGAYARYYKDAYFCTKCLQMRYTNTRSQGNTYEKPIEGTMPMGEQ